MYYPVDPSLEFEECPNCGRLTDDFDSMSLYCPHCGYETNVED